MQLSSYRPNRSRRNGLLNLPQLSGSCSGCCDSFDGANGPPLVVQPQKPGGHLGLLQQRLKTLLGGHSGVKALHQAVSRMVERFYTAVPPKQCFEPLLEQPKMPTWLLKLDHQRRPIGPIEAVAAATT